MDNKYKFSQLGVWILLALIFIVGCFIINIGYNANKPLIEYVGALIIVLSWLVVIIYSYLKNKPKNN